MASDNSPDSQEVSIRIIETISEHPVLYINNVKGTTLKIQDLRQKIWYFIADELGLDGK